MGLVNKLKNKIFPDEKEVLYYSSAPKVNPDLETNYESKELYSPESFEETGKLADKLKYSKRIVINISKLDKTDAMRMLDFLGGLTYALNGDMKKIEKNIFEFTLPTIKKSK